MTTQSARSEESVFKKMWGISLKQKFLFGGILLGILLFAGSKLLVSNQQTTQYQTAQVEKKDIISTVSVSGNIVAAGQVSVTSGGAGIVEELYVHNGMPVVEGENLFKVKSTATPEEIASAYAQYQSAVSSLTSAKQTKQSLDVSMWQKQQYVLTAQNDLDYRNNNTINPATKKEYTALERQTIESADIQARKDFAAAEEKYKQADIAIGAAQAQLNSAWIAYQETQTHIVTAPASGTIANMSMQIGDYVSGSGGGNSSSTSSSNTSSSTNSSSTLFYIGNFSRVRVEGQVNEADMPKIKAGQKATVTLDAFPGKTFVAEVAAIDTVGTSSSGVVSYKVYLTLTSPPDTIAPGMTASAIIQTDKRTDVLTVPVSAVQTSADQSTVRVLNSRGVAEDRTVEVGISSDSDTEIISGLNEGDKVITGETSSSSSQTTTTSPFGGGGFRSGGFGVIRR